MEQQYREMFDEVRPSSHLQEEVKKMSEMERRPSRKRFPKGMLIAAAVLVVLAGTAVATVGMPGTLRGWFAQEWEETTGAPMEEEQLALIDQLTQPVGVSDTQNGVTVTVDSVTVGDSTIWMLLKVSGEYGAHEPAEYYFERARLTLDPDPDELEAPGGGALSYLYSGVAEDGRLTLLVQYSIDMAEHSSLLDQPRQVTLKMENLVQRNQDKSQGNTILAEDSWTLTFPLESREGGSELTLEEIQVPAQKRNSPEMKSITLWDVKISATDITYVCSAEDQEWNPLKCALVLEDGSQVNWSSGSSHFRDAACTEWSSVYYWQVPVDLNNVTALRFGDVEFPLK